MKMLNNSTSQSSFLIFIGFSCVLSIPTLLILYFLSNTAEKVEPQKQLVTHVDMHDTIAKDSTKMDVAFSEAPEKKQKEKKQKLNKRKVSKLCDLTIVDIKTKVVRAPQTEELGSTDPYIEEWIYHWQVTVKNIGETIFYNDLVFSSNIFADENSNNFLFCIEKQKNKALQNQDISLKPGAKRVYSISRITDKLEAKKQYTITVNPQNYQVPRWYKKRAKYHQTKESNYLNNSFVVENKN